MHAKTTTSSYNSHQSTIKETTSSNERQVSEVTWINSFLFYISHHQKDSISDQESVDTTYVLCKRWCGKQNIMLGFCIL
jgi:hypothetical protein